MRTSAARCALAGAVALAVLGAAPAGASALAPFSFSSPSTLALPSEFSSEQGSSVVTAQFTGSGHLDLAYTTGGGSSMSGKHGDFCPVAGEADCVNLITGNGNGTFAALEELEISGAELGTKLFHAIPFAYSAGGTPYEGSGALAAGDLNGDGHPDVVVADASGPKSCGINGCVAFLYGNGTATGTFQTPVLYQIESASIPEAVAVGHFTGSPRLDVAVVLVSGGGSAQVVILQNTGNDVHGHAKFTFFKTQTLLGEIKSIAGITVANLAGNGARDLAISTRPAFNSESNEGECSSSYCLQTLTTSGTEGAAQISSPHAYMTSGAGQIAAGPLEAGARDSIFVPGGSGAAPAVKSVRAVVIRTMVGLEVLPNVNGAHGELGKAATYNYTGESYPTGVAVGDFDYDGQIDAAVIDGNYKESLTALFDGSGGSFTSFGNLSDPNKIQRFNGSIVAADFNGDCKLDLAVVGSTIEDSYVGGAVAYLNETGGIGSACKAPPVTVTTTTTSSTATTTTTTPKVEVKAVREARTAVAASIAAAGLPGGCTRSGVNLKLRLRLSPRALGLRKAGGKYLVGVRTVVSIDGRRIAESGARSFTVNIPTSQFGVGANKVRVTVSTSGKGVAPRSSTRTFTLRRCAARAVFTG